MLHKEIPFLRIGLPLVAGIISGLYFNPDYIILLPAFIIIASGFISGLFFNKYRSDLLFGVSLNISLFLAGLFLYRNEKDSLSELESIPTIFNCYLSDYPAEKANSFMLEVKLNGIITPDEVLPVSGSIILYCKKDSIYRSMLPGDKLVLKCIPVAIRNRGNPYEFDYSFYMENHRIKYYAFSSGSNIISHSVPHRRNIRHTALIIREKIIDIYRQRGVTGERLALVAAITLGQKRMLEPEQKDIFIRAGVMHIMAVSGLHSVILSLFLFNLLFFMKGRYHFLRVIITTFVLWAFAFITGLTPSVLRATLMFTFLQAGNLMERRVNSLNSVLASAFVLIIIRPSVIFDAGFLLSYSAVIYIICFYQLLYEKINFRNWFFDKIWQSAVVTIVAQAGTLPLTTMLFNRFPTYFIFTNIIIVPLSSMLIIIGSLIPLLFPLKLLSSVLGKVLNNMTALTEYLTRVSSSLPFSNIENIGLTVPECILLSLSLFFIASFLLNRKPISIVIPLSCILLYSASVSYKEIQIRKSNELIVYNTQGSVTIGIRTGEILNVYSDTSQIQQEVLRHSSSLGLKLKTKLLSDRSYQFKVGEETIFISGISHSNNVQFSTAKTVIIRGSKIKFENLQTLSHSPRNIIVTSDLSQRSSHVKYSSVFKPDTIHFVKKSGAFIKRL